MIINTDYNETMSLLMTSYKNLLENIEQEEKKIRKEKDPDPMGTLGSRSHDTIKYWFEHYGELKPKR